MVANTAPAGTNDGASSPFDDTGWVTHVDKFPKDLDLSVKGDTYTGTYVKTDVIPVKQDDGTERPTKLHVFADLDGGEQSSLWGSYNVDKGMDPVKPGELVRVIFHGLVTDLKGGRSVNEWTIQSKPA